MLLHLHVEALSHHVHTLLLSVRIGSFHSIRVPLEASAMPNLIEFTMETPRSLSFTAARGATGTLAPRHRRRLDLEVKPGPATGPAFAVDLSVCRRQGDRGNVIPLPTLPEEAFRIDIEASEGQRLHVDLPPGGHRQVEIDHARRISCLPAVPTTRRPGPLITG